MATAYSQDQKMRYRADENAADILIPVRNHYADTRRLLECIYRYADYPFQIYVLDNSSTDETIDLHKIYTNRITIVRNRDNRGWSGAINQGILMARSPYLVFLHHDVELARGWLRNMIAFLKTHPRIGAVGPLVSDGPEWQCVDRVREKLVPQMPQFLTEDIHERNRILQYHFPDTGILIDGPLDFSCVAFTRRAVDETGLLSDNGAEDVVDYCRRMRKAGFVLGLSLDAVIVRHNRARAKPSRTEVRRAPVRKGA
jgi:GT2 family glycosyltransferase